MNTMTPKNLHRAAALLLFLFALTHALGMMVSGGHGVGVDLVILGMQAVPMERLGVERTLMDFHVGYGGIFEVYLLFGVVLSLELSKLATLHPGTATRIALAHGVALCVVFLLCLRYFFVGPTLLALLAAIATIVAMVKTGRLRED